MTIKMPDWEPEDDQDDENIPWDCDGCWELGGFEFDDEYDSDED